MVGMLFSSLRNCILNIAAWLSVITLATESLHNPASSTTGALIFFPLQQLHLEEY